MFRPLRTVAAYVRVSTAEQARGHSIDSQRDTLRQWAQAEGWTVAAVYEDAGASGTTATGRPKFLRMIEDAADGAFDAVLVLKLDRFARNRGDSAIYRTRLESAGVQLLSYNEKTDGLSRAAALLTIGLPELLAEHYSVELSEKTTAGWKKRAEKGLTLGDVPFGYTREHPHEPIRAVPAEARAVLRAFEAYATRRYAMHEVADQLSAQGFAPRSKRGKTRFSKATVNGMLRNAVYAGFVTRHGEILGPGLHEAIVPEALWRSVQAVISEKARCSRAYSRRPKRPYYLAGGLGFCAHCSEPLWANSSPRGYDYYRCASRRRGSLCDYAEVGIRADKVEGELDGLFSSLRLPDGWREYVIARTEQPADEASEAERHYWERQIARAKDGFRAGILDEADAVAMRADAERQLHTLAPPPDADGALAAGDFLGAVGEIWPAMTAIERRDAVRTALQAVGVDIETGCIRAIAPRDEFTPLFAAVAESKRGVTVCNWRPRADSNRRSPP